VFQTSTPHVGRKSSVIRISRARGWNLIRHRRPAWGADRAPVIDGPRGADRAPVIDGPRGARIERDPDIDGQARIEREPYIDGPRGAQIERDPDPWGADRTLDIASHRGRARITSSEVSRIHGHRSCRAPRSRSSYRLHEQQRIQIVSDGPRGAQIERDPDIDGPRGARIERDPDIDGPRGAQIERDPDTYAGGGADRAPDIDGPRGARIERDPDIDGPRGARMERDPDINGPRSELERWS